MPAAPTLVEAELGCSMSFAHCAEATCDEKLTEKDMKKKHRDTSSLVMVAHHQIFEAASSKANDVFKPQN